VVGLRIPNPQAGQVDVDNLEYELRNDPEFDMIDEEFFLHVCSEETASWVLNNCLNYKIIDFRIKENGVL
jgi:hypothetical protein